MPQPQAQAAAAPAGRGDFPIVVIDHGPDGEDESGLGDQVYWCQELDCMATSGDQTAGAELDEHPDGRIVAAECISRAATDPRLANDGTVRGHAFPLTDKADSPTVRYFFAHEGGKELEYELTATVSRVDDGYGLPGGTVDLLHDSGVNRAEKHALFKFPAVRSIAACQAARWRVRLGWASSPSNQLEIYAHTWNPAYFTVTHLRLALAWVIEDFDAGATWPGPASVAAGWFEWRELIAYGTSNGIRIYWPCYQSLALEYVGDAGGATDIYGVKVFWDDSLLAYTCETLTCLLVRAPTVLAITI